MDPTMIGLFLAIIIGFYLLLIRPRNKAQKKQEEMMKALAPGDRIMTGSGIYGNIRHIGEKQAVIEISPGVDMTVLRIAIRRVVQPDEEEFEYASEFDEVDPDSSELEDLESAFSSDLSIDEDSDLAGETSEDTDQDED